jgi:hypothetical protein
MDTDLGISCMPLVVAVSMESHEVTQFVASFLILWGNMVDFHTVSVSEGQFTPATFSLLLLEELGEFSIKHRVTSESLTPVEKVSIIGAGVPFHLHVSSDGGIAMISQGMSLLIPEYPLACFIRLPVAVFYPISVFVGVPTPCP